MLLSNIKYQIHIEMLKLEDERMNDNVSWVRTISGTSINDFQRWAWYFHHEHNSSDGSTSPFSDKT